MRPASSTVRLTPPEFLLAYANAAVAEKLAENGKLEAASPSFQEEVRGTFDAKDALQSVAYIYPDASFGDIEVSLYAERAIINKRIAALAQELAGEKNWPAMSEMSGAELAQHAVTNLSPYKLHDPPASKIALYTELERLLAKVKVVDSAIATVAEYVQAGAETFGWTAS
jgi:hypothetical protein